MFKNKKVKGILQLGISLTLLVWLLGRVGFNEVTGTLANLHWGWYLPAFILFLSNIIIRAYRWYMLLKALNEEADLRNLIYLYFVGFFANNFIPSGFGGDVVKVVSLRQKHGRGAEALSSVLMDRITGLIGSAIIAFVALVWNSISHTTDVDLPGLLWVIIFLISIGIPVGFMIVRQFNPLRTMIDRFSVMQQLPKYDKLLQLEETIRRYPLPTLLRSLGVSIPFTLNLIFVQFSIARALSVDLPLAVFGLFVPVIAILNLLPISFNGLGVREGAYLFLFTPIGVASESAISMSLAFYFLRFGTGLIGGLLYALRSVARLLRSPQAENL